MSEGAGAALSATSGRGLLPLCGGVGPPGAGVFSSPQLQICGLSSVAVEGLGAALRSISGVAEAVPKPPTRGESPLQPPRSATKSTRTGHLAARGGAGLCRGSKGAKEQGSGRKQRQVVAAEACARFW